MVMGDNNRIGAPTYRRFEHFAWMCWSLIDKSVCYTQWCCAERMIFCVKRQNEEALLLFTNRHCFAKYAIGIFRLRDLDLTNILAVQFIPATHKLKRRCKFQHLQLSDAFYLLLGMTLVIIADVTLQSSPIAFNKLRHGFKCIKKPPRRLQHIAPSRPCTQKNR